LSVPWKKRTKENGDIDQAKIDAASAKNGVDWRQEDVDAKVPHLWQTITKRESESQSSKEVAARKELNPTERGGMK